MAAKPLAVPVKEGISREMLMLWVQQAPWFPRQEDRTFQRGVLLHGAGMKDNPNSRLPGCISLRIVELQATPGFWQGPCEAERF